jgi:hypothetical protein
VAICTTCNGTGLCQNCRGTGHFECATCNGTGTIVETCLACGGSGVDAMGQVCSACNGSGNLTVTCRSCYGRGNFECSLCNGTGKCKTCGGTGEIPDSANQVDRNGASLPATISFVDLLALASDRFQAWTTHHFSGGGPFQGAVVKRIDQAELQTALITYPTMQYGRIDRRGCPPFRLDSIHELNQSPTQDFFVYTSRKTSTASVGIQKTKSVKTGQSAGLRIALPVVNIDVSQTESIDFTTQSTQQDSVAQEWSWSQTIFLPPNTDTEISVLVSQQIAEIPVDAVMRITGVVHFSGVCTFPHMPSGEGSFNVSPGLGEFFQLIPSADVSVLSPQTIECRVAAVLEVTSGTDIIITKKSTPLPG